MSRGEPRAHLCYSLCFFVDFMPVNSCTQVLLHKNRVSWKTVATNCNGISPQVPETVFNHVWRQLSCKHDPPTWYSSGVGEAEPSIDLRWSKHAFSHLHNFIGCVHSDSATLWGLIAPLSEHYPHVCHYSDTLLHQPAWAFFIGKGVHSLPARAGLLWSWLLCKLHSHRAARCSEW